MWLPASDRQWALVPWRPRREDPQARRFHSSAVPVTVHDSWSAPTKTNGLKNPIGGLSGPRLEDAAGRETRDGVGGCECGRTVIVEIGVVTGIALETERMLHNVPSGNLASGLARRDGRGGALPRLREKRHRKEAEHGAAGW